MTSRTVRIVSILHLCITFTMLFWIAGYPFMGKHYEYLTKLIVYQTVMGTLEQRVDEQAKDRLTRISHKILDEGGQDVATDLPTMGREHCPSDKARLIGGEGGVTDCSDSPRVCEKCGLRRNFERFQSLPEDQKKEILSGYKIIQSLSDESWVEKCKNSLWILGFGIPPFLQAWFLFSLIICVLLLKSHSGATAALWLLPILSGMYAVENAYLGVDIAVSEDLKLFPTEEMIASKYVNEPLSANPSKLREQLLSGWNQYLVEEWANLMNPMDPFEDPIERGEFAFNLARAKLIPKESGVPDHTRFHQRKHPLILVLFFGWNLYVAFIVKRLRKRNPRAICPGVL